MTSLEQLNPNLHAGQPGDRYMVTTEAHDVVVEVRKVGPQTKGYLLSFVSAEPPVTEGLFYEGEILVKDNEIVSGKDFELQTLFPILTQTAFKALDIQLIESPIVSQ